MGILLLGTTPSSPPASLLKFNFTFDPNWSGASAAYNSALTTAAGLLSAAFPNTNATINITMEYGTFQGGAIAGNSSEGTDFYGSSNATYTLIRNALASIPNPSASLTALLANTPAGTTLNGQTSFYLPSACCKALGLFAGLTGGPTGPTDVRQDGLVGIGVSWPSDRLVGMFLHELTHAMGREAGAAPFSFSRFTSAGNRDFGSSLSNTYFSLDGGTTPLGDYATPANDPGDFSNGMTQDANTGANWFNFPSDPFDSQQSGNSVQALTATDLKLLNAMGFQ